MDRRGELQPELPVAVDAPVAEARREEGMGAYPGLLDGAGGDPEDRSRRSGFSLRVR